MQHWKLQFWSCLKTISSLSLSQAWLATFGKFANGLHLKQGKFRSVCLKYGTKHFGQIKAHLGLFVLTRSLVDVNLNGDLWENSKNWFFSIFTWFLYLCFFCFLFIYLVGAAGQNLHVWALCLLGLISNFHQKVFVLIFFSYLTCIRVVHLLSILLVKDCKFNIL